MVRTMSPRSALLVALVTVLSASTVGAQTLTSDQEAERTALYKAGVKLAKDGRWEEAAGKFRLVVAMRSAPRVLYTLGQAEEKSGKLVSAKAAYARSLEEARSAGDETAAGVAGEALAAIERRVPRLAVRLPAGLENPRTTVDGRQVTPTEQGLEIDPGEHTVVVRGAGQRKFERVVSVSEGQTTNVEVPPDPKGGAPIDSGNGEPSEPRPELPGTPVGAWVLGGAAVAVTIAGGVLFGFGKSNYYEATQTCSADGCSNPEDADDANAARGQQIGGDVLMATGIVALVGAVIWLAVSAGSGPDAPPAALASSGVGLTPGGLFVTWGAAP